MTSAAEEKVARQVEFEREETESFCLTDHAAVSLITIAARIIDDHAAT